MARSNFQGFVCFVLYLDKISGERSQDHWSSGLMKRLKLILESSLDSLPQWFCHAMTPTICIYNKILISMN